MLRVSVPLWLIFSVTYRRAAESRVARAKPHPRLRVNHHAFGVAHVAGLVGELVAARFERLARVGVQSERLPGDVVGHPLMMIPRRVYGLLKIHAEVEHV